MRGKVTGSVSWNGNLGITPAHAGKSAIIRLFDTRTGDHPRTCGEKLIALIRCCCSLGSPPHMRGKGPCFRLDDTIQGITPAHAGKRIANLLNIRLVRDHPRTCGEKMVEGDSTAVRAGSPPHMRGKVYDASADMYDIGITPAHAGKSMVTCFAPMR